MSERLSERNRALLNRWLGVGLAAVIAVVTIVLGVTGRLTLYISPETVWFACAAAVVTLGVAVWSCTLPLGAEEHHAHDHAHEHGTDAGARRTLATAAVISGGVIATGTVLAALVLPPASLSAELAMSRAGERTTLFAGADDVSLGIADTTTFGVGEWSSVFATATRPEAYDGSTVTLTGFVTPSDAGGLNLTRMVITHCVIDAQPASVPLAEPEDAGSLATGDWIEVTGTVRADGDGTLRIEPASVTKVDEPKDPYEY
ncbi:MULTISPECIES: TIGR03943 family putative permease subunit [Microbacterium]|uniref:TIGR03943 family putative permease subunit n=1 Tax=Microbacterium TaxID=33882 RepID=UPI00217EE272|nr:MULTISPECIES: TIGR03943 family protein [Microbacterium]UWF77472.1 TIGR03943 family protein [Microbacterium neungamense]WCM55635.1 TIGR03943 family protein [Microbacterium sp. EF45047]